MELLNKVNLLLGTTDKDDVLTMLIEDAKDEAMNYCNLIAYNVKLEPTIIKMVVQNYNKGRIQGIISESYSGVTQAYSDGYTKDIYIMLNKNRKLKTL